MQRGTARDAILQFDKDFRGSVVVSKIGKSGEIAAVAASDRREDSLWNLPVAQSLSSTATERGNGLHLEMDISLV